MEGEDEDNVKMLMDMGFPDEEEVRAALRMAKNEISDAVTFLTDENFKSNMYQSGSRALALSGPSNYGGDGDKSQEGDKSNEASDDNSLVFPYDELLELERRVNKDQWSIPYKRRESLGKCLMAATRLAKEGLSEADDNCRRFTGRVMMQSFTKLLTSSAVYSWQLEIHQGICNMLELFVSLVIARLPHPPVPCDWLTQILAQAFDPETAWNQKNKSKHPSIRSGADMEDYACTFHIKGGTYGWLADLINHFGSQGGFVRIKECLQREDLTLAEMSALLAPLGRGAELLVGERVKPLMSSAMENTMAHLVSLDENKLNGKDARAVLELLGTMKRLFCYLWTENEDKITELQLSILVRMLKTPNFSTRMNALQEISVLIEETERPARHVLGAEEVQTWMSEQGVLSLALEGNIDQKQYTDRIKAIIEFLGPHLSTEDLSKIWSMQSRHAIQVMENIHCMMAAAAVNFSAPQLQHLISLIERSWEGSKPWQQEGLLQLVGRMGRERRDPASAAQMLELLWRLAHAPGLSSRLVQMATELQTEVLAEGTNDEQVKLYISKCVDDISNRTWTVPALRHIHNIVDKIIHGTKSYIKIDKSAFNELMYVQHDIPRLITGSLSACHQRAVAAAAGSLHRQVIVDGDYRHGECLSTHLEVLQHLLKDARVPLEWERVEDIWAALVDNLNACPDDGEICFDWFTGCVGDLSRETQTRFFEEKLLRLDPTPLTASALACFKTYFERVNLDKAIFRRLSGSLVVGGQSPVGVGYLWRILTEVADEEISRAVIDQLLEIYYLNLEPRLKRDPASQHNKFFNECYNRLESRRATVFANASDVQMTPVTPESPASSPSKASGSRQSGEASPSACCPERRGLRRLLFLVRAYVERIEALYTESRSIPAHGATFRGAPLTLHLTHDGTEAAVQAHANESVESLRQRAAGQLKLASASLQLQLGDSELDTPHQLLHRAGVTGGCRLTVRSVGSATARARNSPEADSESAAVPEGGAAAPAAGAFAAPSDVSSERSLPGVVMAAGGAFSTLCGMAELRHGAITAAARDILHLMPTEPEVSDVLEALCEPAGRQAAGAPTPAERVRQLLGGGGGGGDQPPATGLRLLYNLEVLSGKLMPCRSAGGTAESARSFCRAFLEYGGLTQVLAALRREPAAGDDQGLVQQQTYLTLQIARFLLCDRPELSGALLSSPGARPTPAKKSALDATAAASNTVHSLSAAELHETVSCLLRLSSCAAAGRLGRDKRSQVEFYLAEERRRQSSTGSTTSSASEGEGGGLQAGPTSRPDLLAEMETLVAALALQLMVNLLQSRPQALGHVYSLPHVRDRVVNMLLDSPSAEVRSVVADQMVLVSEIVTPQVTPSPRDFLTQVVLKTRVPLWVPSGSSRAGSHRLKAQSEQYFRLRAHLLTGLSAADQARLAVSASSMAEDEVGWLHNFSPAPGQESSADDVLLAGHLDLVRALVTCQGADRRAIGQTLIGTLMDDFLFPASRRQGTEGSPVSLPRCTGKASRTAAYRLFVELCRDCADNLELICSQLVERHHAFDGELSKEFDYAPPLESRAACNYVGLKNAGATCYMNSVLQQLYLVPGLREAILGVQDDQVTEESVLCQLQMVFGHLLELKLQYFSPERFWTVFRLRGQPINVREQQDAYEFFTNLLDQTDEQLRRIQREPVFQQVFEGTFSDQKICKDCPHRYEREETFNALNLAIKSGTLQESLQQFVREEIMDGDNSYFCDKCAKKREAVKRTLIKSLPPMLVIQLKRFGYDWLAGHSIKFDGFFQFPFTLDMGPYTEEGVTAAQAAAAAVPAASGGDARRQRLPTPGPAPVLYELVGVVVHSGQASAGHYYSYAKDRRGSSLSNPNKGQWYKFNDTTVEPVDMTEELLEQECFGGNYKVKVSDSAKPKWGPSEALPETRLRYWNGYMLFYEQVNDRLKTPRTPRKSMSASRLSRSHSRPLSRRNEDSLCQLTELVQQGDASDLFPDRMPSAIHQVVRDTNLKFMQNREIYSDEYFNFIYDLVTCNMACGSASLAVPATSLAVHFLLHTYLHARRRCGAQTQRWLKALRLMTEAQPAAAGWLLRFLSREDGQRNFRPFLLVCDNAAVRFDFTQLIMIGLRAHFHHRGCTTDGSVQTLLRCLVEKHFPDSIRSCSQYMSMLSEYAHMGGEQCAHLLSLGVLPRLTSFLLGPPGGAGRWTVSQARQLGELHTLLALLLLSCLPDAAGAAAAAEAAPPPPDLLYGDRSEHYLREVLTTLREPSWRPQHVVRLLVRASQDQAEFSRRLTTALMRSCGATPCDELRHLSLALGDLLTLEDDCQQLRLDIVLDGVGEGDDSVEGMLGLIRKTSGANSRRAYQCIKFLVSTAARCEPLKLRLLSRTQRWLWAISWLREQMSEQAEIWDQPESAAAGAAAASNDDSSGRMFRRTTSAQMTLDECSRLFTVEDAEMELATGDRDSP